MKTTPPETIITPVDITETTIKNAMMAWFQQRTRFDTLYKYYIGDHPFGEAHTKEPANNRIVANHCKYISEALRGYMTGNPPHYDTSDGDRYGREIIDLMHKQSKETIDSQIALDMSRYGKAFELVYLPAGKDEPNSVTVSPRNAFVAYAGDMERDSVFGAVVYSKTLDDHAEEYTLYLYTRTDAQTFTSKSQQGPWTPIGPAVPHGFGRVPLIEYRNNGECIGDYEPILDLQDAYNSLLSDRQDDKDAFAMAMLFITGSLIGTTPEEIEEGKDFLRQHRVLQGDEDTTASYLTKTMDEGGIQILQDQYSTLIHKLAMVPDLSDEQFAGNASGVAMAYKLFGTDQMMAEKVARFRMGFRRRVKLYDYRMFNPSNSPNYEPMTDMEAVNVSFQFNTPEDLAYMAGSLTQLTAAGIMSKRTAMTQLSVIPDPEAEQRQIDEESKSSADSMQSMFEDDFTGSLNRAIPQEDEDDGDASEVETARYRRCHRFGTVPHAGTGEGPLRHRRSRAGFPS